MAKDTPRNYVRTDIRELVWQTARLLSWVTKNTMKSQA